MNGKDFHGFVTTTVLIIVPFALDVFYLGVQLVQIPHN